MEERSRRPFGTMPDGTQVEEITLRSGGLTAGILTYGGAVRTLTVPGRSGAAVDVALGFDSLEDYRRQDKYLGALVGRVANRIGGARFSLGGREYPLAANNGENHIHGGLAGFDRQVWQVEEAGADRLVLSLFSPDGQEGYPATCRSGWPIPSPRRGCPSPTGRGAAGTPCAISPTTAISI